MYLPLYQVADTPFHIQGDNMLMFRSVPISYQVALIRNNAREVEFNATSESNLLRARATAEANAIIETARSDGLKFLYGELNIDNQEQKAAFDYLRTLRGKESLHLTVDFNQAIVGPIEP